MAVSLKSTESGAKRNILGKVGLRYVGFLTAFIGLLLYFVGTNNVVSTILKVVSILLVLVGILMISGNVKIIIKSKKDKDALTYLLAGIIILILGVLLYLFGGAIAGLTNLILGGLIAAYALVAFIMFITSKGAKNKKIFHSVLAGILFAAGVCILLLYWISAPLFLTITWILATVIGITHVIVY